MEHFASAQRVSAPRVCLSQPWDIRRALRKSPCSRRFNVLLAAVLATACGDPSVEPPPENRPPVASAAIPPLTVEVGDTATIDLSAHFNDPDGDALSYTAHTADPTVATTSVSGSTASITGVEKGATTVTITAVDPGGLAVHQSFEVTVPNRHPVVDSIPPLELVTGESAAVVLSAYFSDPDGDALSYVAESSDEAVATVVTSSDTLTVTGTGQGTASVTVTATDTEGSATPYGIGAGVEGPVPTTVVVSPDTVLLTALDQEVPLTAEVFDQIGRPLPDAVVSWESGDPAIATIDSAGTATAAENGTTAVTATAGDASGEAHLTVRQVARSITVSPTTPTIVADDTLRLDATALDENGHLIAQAVFAWVSRDTSVARVDDGGLVAGVREGSATISAGLDGEAGTTEVTVLHQDRAALIAFFNATGGSAWTSRRNWLTDAPVRRWHGVRALQDGRVSGLILDDNGLSGSVPPELGDMAGLRQLDLTDNEELAGELPGALASLDPLDKLLTGGTGVCAPSDTTFLAWMERIPESRVARCEAWAAYLTQAVQSRDYPVPLVAGEEALLRVFVTAARSGGDRIPRVRATFYLRGVRRHVADIPERAGTLPTEVDESDLGASANAAIPASWVKPGLEMVIDVDPDGALDPSLGVPKRIPESGRIEIPVYEMPRFDLTLIPFLWQPKPDSAVIDSISAMAADPDGHDLLWATRTLLPIAELGVTAHDPVVTTSNYPPDLLRQTLAIQTLDGGRGYYMGMMTGRLTSRISGAAYVSGRSSFAVPHATTMAHELGHNLGLLHAPCGGAGLQDPSYPFRDGSIGAWGYDAQEEELVTPRRQDLMSYCTPRWIGDYHFSRTIRHRAAAAGALAARTASRPERSLLLWGGVDARGSLHLEPAITAEIPPALPLSGGDYIITGHTRDGRELFSLRFEMMEIGGGGAGFAYALPALPEWAGTLASITLSGPAGSVTLDESTDQAVAIVRDPGTGRVHAILRGESAVRAMREGAAAGPGEGGLQVLFSRGVPTSDEGR